LGKTYCEFSNSLSITGWKTRATLKGGWHSQPPFFMQTGQPQPTITTLQGPPGLPRNCYIHEDELLPFDVIVCRPDEELEKLLQWYPET
jgi:hypothetical protein